MVALAQCGLFFVRLEGASLRPARQRDRRIWPVAAMRKCHMRLLSLARISITVILVALGTGLFSRAEAVEHHGYNADATGSHDGCLSCHNNKIAPSNPRCMPVCLFGKSHPVNLVYPPPNRKNEFKPALIAQQNGIMFVDGKMDCISCHSLNAKSRYHLRVNNWENQICNACHIK
jgi:hypothetical protein